MMMALEFEENQSQGKIPAVSIPIKNTILKDADDVLIH
jgi:hypothetical protein